MDLLPLSTEITLTLVILSIAYILRGVVGFGSGLIAIPFLVLLLPLQVAVVLIALLDYISSLTHGFHGRHHIKWSLIWPIIPFNIIGVLLAVLIFQNTDIEVLIKLLAVLIFIYAIYYLIGIKLKQHTGKIWAAPAGILGSMIGTLFSTGGPFYVIYLQLQGLNKSVFRATFASIFLIDGCLRIGSYFFSDLITNEVLTIFIIALPIMFISLYVGQHIHTRISQLNFQRIIGVLLVISSITLFNH